MKSNEFFNFCMNLRGYKLFCQGIEVPKYILFWSGISAEKILKGKTNINLIPRD